MNDVLNFEMLEQLLQQREFRKFRAELEEAQEIDVAAFIEWLDDESSAVLAFRMMPKEMAAEVFANLDQDTQRVIIAAMTDHELAAIVEDLAVDDAVDIVEDMPANMVKRILKNANSETRGLINQFLHYPDSTAGSIMTAEFADLRPDMTIASAIDHIRKTGEDRETIYTCYVIDQRRILIGAVSVKDLLLASDEQMVSDVMTHEVVSAATSTDREEVVRLMSRYDLISMPVVDKEERLVGLVTVDDAVDVMQQEATEDFEKMAAMTPSEKPYLRTSVFSLAKNRIVWLLVLMFSSMLTGGILEKYEAAFAAMPLLVTFIPMLMGTGGNAGSQSSTLIIRGIAVSEITTKDVLSVIWKELRVSSMVGIALAAINFGRLMIQYPGNTSVALTVSATLFCTIIIAKTLGAVLPIAVKMVKADPAIMAAPLVTTFVDVMSLMIYFSIASKLLNL